MVHPMGWKLLGKYLYTALNATLRSKNRNQFESWLLYVQLFYPRSSRIPLTHRFVFRDVNLYYLKRMTQSWWRFSSHTISTDILLSDNGILLTNNGQSNIIDYTNASNRLHSSGKKNISFIDCFC
jgi:hypothetical protein